MASYLLNAKDADMARWQEDAKRAGVSFAEHIRLALDAQGSQTGPKSSKASVPSEPTPTAQRKEARPYSKEQQTGKKAKR